VIVPKAEKPATVDTARGLREIDQKLAGLIDFEAIQLGIENQAAVLGVDLGNAGALAVLTPAGDLLAIFDMPCLADGPAGRRTVNAPLLAEIVARSCATKAFIEYVGARPGEGPVGAFAFGRSRGAAEGVCAALNVTVTFITPPQWKRLVGIPPSRAGAKDAARSEAIRRWPQHAGLFSRVRDDGRAEAALIAVAGLMRREARR
jgi:crossover junction endodeoxyribonuclease RuvC